VTNAAYNSGTYSAELFGTPLSMALSNNMNTVTAQTQGGTVTANFNTTNLAAQTRNGKTVIQYPGAVTASTDPAVQLAANPSATLNSYGTVVGLAYTDFGTWNVSVNGSTVYAAVYGGAQPGGAATATMPTTGTATFSGGATGLVVQPGNTNPSASFYGAATMSANFASGAISGSISSINAYKAGGTSLIGTINAISFTATIAGSSFAGTTTASAAPGTAYDISGANGQIRGAFYGPNATEAAGIFNLTGGTNSIGLTGGFGMKQPTPSDRRLKTDVAPVGVLPNGLPLYTWRYLGGRHRFVGVMAQDVLADRRLAAAVIVDGDGLMRVDYTRIGYAPADMAAMQAEGEAAVARWRSMRR